MKKVKIALLEQLITEELLIVLQEVGFMNKLKKFAAGAALAGSMAGASPGLADKPPPASTTQAAEVSDSEFHAKDVLAQIALGSLHDWEKSTIKKGSRLSFDEQVALTLAQRACWLEAQGKEKPQFKKTGAGKFAQTLYETAIKNAREYVDESPKTASKFFSMGDPKKWNFEETKVNTGK